MALAACSDSGEGEDQNPIGMGGAGGVGGTGGAGGTGGVGGAGGIGGVGGAAGMMNVGGMGGTGGAAGTVAGAGGMGGAAGDVAGGMGGGGAGGMGGMGGMGGGGAGGEGGMGGAGGDMPEDKGMGDGSDVITIGDSWMRLNPTEGVELSLEKVSGRDYRNYGVPGTMILDGAIPGQFTRAVQENPNIKTVIMTGGGNDILIGNIFCTVSWAESCNDTVYEVADALAALRTEMAEAGVEDVVLLSYDYIPNMVVKPGLDLSIMLSEEMCVPGATPRCHFLNNANTVSGMIRADGIHPTGAGYDLLGERVWDLMQERGVRR